jgi:hypothetical protein
MTATTRGARTEEAESTVVVNFHHRANVSSIELILGGTGIHDC